jgi:hypothetical protein
MHTRIISISIQLHTNILLRWDVVKVARDEPYRYGKNGELLIDFASPERSEQESVDSKGVVQTVEYGGVVGNTSDSDVEKGQNNQSGPTFGE